MTALSRRFMLAASGVAAFATGVRAQAVEEPVRIMEKYAASLRAKDAEALVDLYADDGVFIRPEMSPVTGRAALREAYKRIFATLEVDLTFDVHEVETSGSLAWLRASSKGRVKVVATGVTTQDFYNEVVVFRLVARSWKIRSYLYAPAKASTPSNT